MHLPAPFRAAVGLVATAAEEARRLPDRALELPMLAVSTALQASVRAQQRYARLTARGDAVLNRTQPTDEPPAWATFDDPPANDRPGPPTSRFDAVDSLPGDSAVQAARLVGELMGSNEEDAQAHGAPNGAQPAPEAPPEPPATRKPAARTQPKQPPVKKAAAKSAGRSAAKKSTGAPPDSTPADS